MNIKIDPTTLKSGMGQDAKNDRNSGKINKVGIICKKYHDFGFQ